MLGEYFRILSQSILVDLTDMLTKVIERSFVCTFTSTFIITLSIITTEAMPSVVIYKAWDVGVGLFNIVNLA